ncbi:DUF4192 domain-containing protein [Amycolatopsis anabasis]|uniref:DUF4192 domain-containing protein n=1 Tax=Amycolatopsis anabasis TaxID=1840409 RepID=UPI00131EBA43|nr:DUF4192 domain-containing protein [Amycolatopsis anabasis]
MTTSSTADRIQVNLSEPAQLISAIPHLLGFRPAESLVLIGHSPGAGRRVGLVQRLDLPAREYERAAAEHLAANLGLRSEAPAIGATVIVVGRRTDRSPPDERPPHGRFVKRMTEALRRVGVPVLHAMWTPEIRAGVRWRCYDDQDCGGLLPDPGSTVMAAAAASVGMVTFGSREAMERQLAPDDPGALARRAGLLEAARNELDDDPGRRAEAGRAEVRAALRQAADGELALTDEQVVRLVLALSETKVRDACLATALPPEGKRSQEAERLWTALIRAAPAPGRAEPASLLGFSAYMRGDGTLANMALENALRADPRHTLAQLLSQCLWHGTPPRKLRRLASVDTVPGLWEPDR